MKLGRAMSGGPKNKLLSLSPLPQIQQKMSPSSETLAFRPGIEIQPHSLQGPSNFQAGPPAIVQPRSQGVRTMQATETWASHGGSVVKKPPTNTGDTGLVPRDPWVWGGCIPAF